MLLHNFLLIFLCMSMSNPDLDELDLFKLLTIAQFVKTPFINLIAYEISDYH